MGERGAFHQVAPTKLRVVSNASPMIALAEVNLLDALAPLFAELVLPPAVVQEVAPSGIRPNWVRYQALGGAIDPRVVRANLGPGETDAIGLTLELATFAVALDERRARRFATDLGLQVVGTVGILLAAKQHGLIPAVKPPLQALIQGGFFVSPTVVAAVLVEADEGD